MKFRAGLAAIAILAIGASQPAVSQQSDDAAVWSVIEQQWEAAQRGDEKWLQSLVAADFVGWPRSSPAPRDKRSTRMWNEFRNKHRDGKAHELYPLSIVVHGDTAVAHYLYTNAAKNADGKLEISNGRYTDVLVRIDGEWKFLSWHGGDDTVSD
ncbi:MAG: nuclear transport factor 2 family protein [Gammaproteobacteria bacterium]|nr:nuclear transport factor 2 family protein [Gammaproteobacteria bacterium]